MKKKLFLLLFLVLISTGCTANYTLIYKDGVFTEDVTIEGSGQDQGHPSYENIVENGLYSDTKEREKFNIREGSNKKKVRLTHKLEDVKLNELRAVKECFEFISYEETDNSIMISLYGQNYCANLAEGSTFTLDTPNVLYSHNADEVKGNKYIWKLNNKELKIKFHVVKSDGNYNPDKAGILPVALKLVIGVVIILSGIIMVVILRKKETNE